MTRPSAHEIPYIDPLTAASVFAGDDDVAFLDSADEAGGRGRYSYIATDPVRVLRRSLDDDLDADPFAALKDMRAQIQLEHDPDLPPFQTGLCGILGYELGRAVERLPKPKDVALFPDIVAGVYDTVLAFDAFQRRAWIITSDVSTARPSQVARAQTMADRVARAEDLPALQFAPGAEWSWELDRAAYMDAVQQAIDYIYAGDIFQANITTRATAPLPTGLDDFTLYRRLRWASPAPFAAFMRYGGTCALLSASPERFLQLSPDRAISTRPIKGTRPRADTPEQDAAYAVELTESEKDRAENLMIVDLLRNDISRVAMIGSVGVSSLLQLETFANVHHLVSEVVGKLRPGYDAIDLLRAAFPGGSVTGAPKIRAMEIINELEPCRRGPYCGSVFWTAFDGAMDSSIVIRSLVVADGLVAAHAGGGIVADSNPAAEYDEMRTKAQAMLASLDKGQSG